MDLFFMFVGVAMFFTGLYKVAGSRKFAIPALVSLAGAVVALFSAWEVL